MKDISQAFSTKLDKDFCKNCTFEGKRRVKDGGERSKGSLRSVVVLRCCLMRRCSKKELYPNETAQADPCLFAEAQRQSRKKPPQRQQAFLLQAQLLQPRRSTRTIKAIQ